jgi:signal transduction histidine kinase/ActR/RegA family two-component response regulator
MSRKLLTGPSLILLEGPVAGRSYGLGRPVTTIGRDPGCDVVLPLVSVSRNHARILLRGDTYELEDLGSTTGTLLNGRPQRGLAPLRDGDRIGIGGCLLAFSDPDIMPSTWTTPAPHILRERPTTETGELALVGVRPEEKLAALLEISRSLVGALGLGEVLHKVLHALFRIFPQAERGIVLLQEEGSGTLVPAAVEVRGGGPAGLVVSRAIQDYVLAEGKVVLSEDVSTDARFSDSRSLEEAHIRSLICVPLRDLARRPTGILQLDTSDLQAGFSEADLDLLAVVAGQVTMAVNNARLLEQSRLEQRRLELLSEAGMRLGVSLDAEETFQAAAHLAVPLLADLCLVDMLDEGGTIRRLAVVHADPAKQPLADELFPRGPTDPADPSPPMLALGSGRPETSELAVVASPAMTARDAEDWEPVRRLGGTSYLCIPMVARGRPLGVLTLVATENRRPLGPSDQVVAEGLARRAALAADNARLYQEANAASRAKDRFLAVLSHELRNPLTPILLAASAMLKGDAAPARSTLEMIQRNVELEARLIDDLLDVARIGRGTFRLALETLDAHDSIHRAVAICQEEADAAGLAIELDLAADSHHVQADPARLLQVSWNLIRNAAKFTPAGGRLTIRTSNRPGRVGDREGRFLVMEFRDTGVGIEPALLGRIFEPFEQGDAELRGRQGGLGLGLAIGRAIAEAHGGVLTAESDGLNSGSTFRLELPTVPAPASPPEAEPPALRPAPTAPRFRVLLVEDQQDTLRFLAMVLRTRGQEVVEAANLAQARAAASEARFDLLLSDIELPDGTGLELMRELRDTGTILGIAMSGYGSEEDVSQSRAAGFAAHLTKPVDLAALEAVIRGLASPGGPAPRSPEKADDPAR